MKAVNLIPAEQRRGAGGAAGVSGGGVYVLLGALALMVVMAGAWAVAGKSVNDKRADLTRVNRDADAAMAKAKALESYTRFSDVRAKRVDTVTSLARSRFDWSHALREVARVIPEDAWLTNLVGTVTPGVAVSGGGSGTSGLRAARPDPAIEVVGCTTNQRNVARIITRMRLIDGVEGVSLAQSEKSDAAAAGGASSAGGGGSSDCRNGSDEFPKFNLVVFFKPTPAAVPSATAGAQTAAVTGSGNASPQPTSASSSSTTQPASGGQTP